MPTNHARPIPRTLLALLTAFALLAVCALPAAAEPLPTGDALAQTIFGTDPALDWPVPKSPRQVRQLQVQNRRVPPIFWYAEAMDYTVALQDGPAPLMFVLAGTGARHDGAKPLYLADLFFSMGYHVATISSPTHFSFLVSASRHGAAGYAPFDVDDLYRVLGWVREDLSRDVEITAIDLSGYSLGGMHAAFLAKRDQEQGRLGFGRVLLINPAVDLYASALRFDSWLSPKSLDGRTPREVLDELVSKVSEFYRNFHFDRFDSDFLFRLQDSAGLSDADMRAIVAGSFRMSAASMIFASDACLRAGYLIDPDTELSPMDSLTPYFSAAMRITFKEYVAQYLLPYVRHLRPAVTEQDFLVSVRLRSIGPWLAGADHVVLVGTENDPILNADELDFLRRTFGPERMALHPEGGHLGNLKNGRFVLSMQRMLREAGR